MSLRAGIEAIGGRRYLLVLLTSAASTVLQYMGKLDPGGTTYAAIIALTVGAYIGGNTTQKVMAPEVKE
jgi:uncharacterized membrane protein YfcA